MKKFLFSRTFIGLCLLGLGIALILKYILTIDYSFTVLTHSHEITSYISLPKGEILKGEKLAGFFTSKEPNLGIVVIRFDNLNRVNEDYLRFSLKEKGKRDWYYQTDVYARKMYGYPMYPIGFPPLPNSFNKTYYFEVESLQGKPGNAVALDTTETPNLFSKYQYPKALIQQDKEHAFEFLTKKTLSLQNNYSLTLSILLYLLPFILYLILCLYEKKIITFGFEKFQVFKNSNFVKNHPKLKKMLYSPINKEKLYGFFSLSILLIAILIDIFFIPFYALWVTILIPFLIIITLKKYQLDSSRFVYIATVAFISLPFLFLVNKQAAQDLTSWLYIYAVIMLINTFRDLIDK